MRGYVPSHLKRGRARHTGQPRNWLVKNGKCPLGELASATQRGRLVWQGLAFGFGGEPDDDDADGVDQADADAGEGIAVGDGDAAKNAVIGEEADELSADEGTNGRKDAPKVEAKALARRANTSAEKFGQVEWKPAVKRSGARACKEREEK